ncbi:hypothetical protein SAMN04488510_12722 [Fervidobacterium changbaicum]|uniref:Uncharacterized protein n=1 Tax=Fervidobacterium changbaicum TaxID=310769 RepID=A0ABX5QSU9_9BACT|nr:hypothetical protein [Fervidobacterium changbaicum]QAV33180.1 hypothetical protein CBS1_05195 [Fervidobacterium changbaicum]SDH70866.1 hypothetical protein SAMN04488510_12722 [Fervidobacterium changbaicum]
MTALTKSDSKLGECLKKLLISGDLSEDCRKTINQFISGMIIVRTKGRYSLLGRGTLEELVDDIFQESAISFLNKKEKLMKASVEAIVSYFSKIVMSRIEDVRRTKQDAESLNREITSSQSDDHNNLEFGEIISVEPSDCYSPYDELIAEAIYETFKNEFVNKEADLCDFIYTKYEKDTDFREYPSADAKYKAHQRIRERIKKFFTEVVDVSDCVIMMVLKMYKSKICDKMRYK